MNTNTCRCPPASEQTSAKTHLQLSECECSCFTSQHHQNRRMASFICRTLVLLFICIALQEGCGFPLSERAELPAQTAPPHRVRTKRCSCSSWDDKECIYFCHLDIIWVNTPSKLLPYGLGSSQSGRRRRSVDRCECLNPADKTCSGFCHTRSDRPKEEKPASTNRSRLLEFLRSVVKSNMAIAESVQSVMRSSGGVNRSQR